MTAPRVPAAQEGARINEFVTLFNTKPAVFNNVILSGLTFYGYNELATMTLTKISSVTNSVANTAKRVVVIVGIAMHISGHVPPRGSRRSLQ